MFHVEHRALGNSLIRCPSSSGPRPVRALRRVWTESSATGRRSARGPAGTSPDHDRRGPRGRNRWGLLAVPTLTCGRSGGSPEPPTALPAEATGRGYAHGGGDGRLPPRSSRMDARAWDARPGRGLPLPPGRRADHGGPQADREVPDGGVDVRAGGPGDPGDPEFPTCGSVPYQPSSRNGSVPAHLRWAPKRGAERDWGRSGRFWFTFLVAGRSLDVVGMHPGEGRGAGPDPVVRSRPVVSGSTAHR